MLETLKRHVVRLNGHVDVLFMAYLDKRTPWHAKLWVLLVISYAVSPIDLLPDFIPVLGMLDDIILIPLGVAVAIRLIPRAIWEDCKRQHADGMRISTRYRIIGMIVVLLLWSLLIFTIYRSIHETRTA